MSVASLAPSFATSMAVLAPKFAMSWGLAFAHPFALIGGSSHEGHQQQTTQEKDGPAHGCIPVLFLSSEYPGPPDLCQVTTYPLGEWWFVHMSQKIRKIMKIDRDSLTWFSTSSFLHNSNLSGPLTNRSKTILIKISPSYFNFFKSPHAGYDALASQFLLT